MTHDIAWSGLDVERADDGDLATVTDADLVVQSVELLVSDELDGVIGQPLTGQALGDVESKISAGIRRRSDVTIQGIDITDASDDTITVRVQTTHRDIEVTV